jgi:hypothetical protein
MLCWLDEVEEQQRRRSMGDTTWEGPEERGRMSVCVVVVVVTVVVGGACGR